MSYAYLGQSCQSNADVLLDNRKFLPLNNPNYDLYYTNMYQYPSTQVDIITSISTEVTKPEDIKTARHVIKPAEEYASCCGKK